jgi:hypothetical protein
MLQLRIDQQYAKIGLNISKPVLNLETTLPVVELDIKKPQIRIESPRPVLHIDQTQCFADAGKRKPLDFARYCSDQAQNDLAAGIDRIVEEGNMLGQIENGNSIPQLAAESAGDNLDFNVTAIPKQRPDIRFDIYPVKIELSRGSVNLQLQRAKYESNLQRGQVSAYMLQQNYIKVNWQESQLNLNA